MVASIASQFLAKTGNPFQEILPYRPDDLPLPA